MNARNVVIWSTLIGSAWLAIAGDRSSDTGIAQPTKFVTASPRDSSNNRSNDAKGTASTIPPDKDEQLLVLLPRTQREDEEVSRKETALFDQKSWAPPPPPPPPTALVSRRPMAPPLPYQYVGKQWLDNRWTIFLARDDATYRARIGDLLDETYRVEAIDASVLVLRYLPLKQEQTLPIE